MAFKRQNQHLYNTAPFAVIWGTLLFLVLSVPFRGMSQQVRVILEPDSLVIGQRAKLTIEVDVAPGTTIVHPNLNDTLGNKIEIIALGKSDTMLIGNNLSRIRQEVLVTAWEPGFIAIPPLPFGFITAADTIIIDSEPVLWQVGGIEVAQDATPFDIKPIFKMPLTLGEILIWAIPLLLITALVIGIIYWYIKKRKKKQISENIWEMPDIPAHIAAISSLESLKTKRLWQSGKVKLYHSDLTFILRMYLEKRFGIIALEMTTSEIMKALAELIKEEDLTGPLRNILELADLVKFAKFEPLPKQNEDCIETALDFVKRTIPPVISNKAKSDQHA